MILLERQVGNITSVGTALASTHFVLLFRIKALKICTVPSKSVLLC